MRNNHFSNIKGFTLIELVIGIVVLAISFSIISNLLLPLSEKSAEQIHQIRAAELGQSLMNEILAQPFDENSDRAGGLIRCGESVTSCTAVNSLGFEGDPDKAKRINFNDVDDYIAFDFSTDVNTLDEKFAVLYPGFNVEIDVFYSNFDGTESATVEIAKLITITVTTPQDFDFVFSFYKANF